MDDEEVASLLDSARSIVESLLLTEVVGTDEMSGAEILDQLERIHKNEQLFYAVMRVLACSAGVPFAVLAEQKVGAFTGPEFDQNASDSIRRTVRAIEMKPMENPDFKTD
jgi:hypothetical protein